MPAWRTGVAAARGRYVCLIDADLQYQPEDVCASIASSRDRRRRRAGLAQLGRARARLALPHRARAQHAAQPAFGMHLQDNKSGFVMLREREVMEDLLTLHGQLLLLAVVHHGGGPRQGLLVQRDRDALREAPPGRRRSSSRRTVKRSLRSLRRPRQGRRGVPRLGRRTTRAQFLERQPARSPTRPAPTRTRCGAAARVHGDVLRNHDATLDDHARRRATTTRAEASASGCRRRRCASCRTRSCAAWCATRTATSPTTAADAGARLRPEDIRGQDDLHKLPFLTKADVREHLYFDIMSENHDKGEILQDHHRAARPASRSSATPTARSSSSAGRRRCARRSGPATASATRRCGSGTRRSA